MLDEGIITTRIQRIHVHTLPRVDDSKHQSLMSLQNKEIGWAVNVMSSPVVLRGRGQDFHCQPSC